MSKDKTKTHHDGWECVPELQEAMDTLSRIDSVKYEITMCCRHSTLRHIVYTLQSTLKETLEILEEIDETEEFESEDED